MDFDVTISTNMRRRLDSGLVDQVGELFPELPPGAEMAYESSDVQVCNPLPLPGGVSASLPSGKPGTAVITTRPGGTISEENAGPAFAPREGQVTIVLSAPAGFHPTVSEEEPEGPEPTPV